MISIKGWLGGVLLLALLTVGGCSLISELSEPQAPDARIVGQRVVALNLNQVDLEVDVAVYNPNRFSVPVGALDYELKIQDHRLVSGEQHQGTTLARGEEVLVTFPVTLEFVEVASALGGLVGTNELHYQLLGGMRFDLPLLGQRRVSLETEGRFPVPQVPRVEVARLRADSLSFTNARLVMDVNLRNPNVFNMQVAEFDYGLNLNTARVAGGELAPGLTLPAGKQVTLEVPFSVSLLDLGRSGFTALMDGSPMNYSLTFSSAFGSDFAPLGTLNYAAEREGRLPLQR